MGIYVVRNRVWLAASTSAGARVRATVSRFRRLAARSGLVPFWALRNCIRASIGRGSPDARPRDREGSAID
jgi:hypothetical protein